MSNANDGHVSHPQSSQKAEWQRFCDRVDTYVEKQYGHVMSPWQRDLVKRIAKGDEVITARPYVHRHCRNLAREVVAIVSAGQAL